MTLSVGEALGLESEGAKEVQIRTFGSDSTTLQTVEMIRVAISHKNDEPVHVLFSSVSLICEPLSLLTTRHLANLDLADFSQAGDELQIDTLIGSDHYWQLMTGKVIQAEWANCNTNPFGLGAVWSCVWYH